MSIVDDTLHDIDNDIACNETELEFLRDLPYWQRERLYPGEYEERLRWRDDLRRERDIVESFKLLE